MGQGWRMFQKAVALIFINFDEAVRVSLPVCAVWLLGELWLRGSAGTGPMQPSEIWPVVIWSILAAGAFLWTVVAWHRFVLLEDRPGLWPPLYPARMLGYLGRSILIGIVLMMGLVPAAFLMPALTQGGVDPNSIATVIGIIAGPALTYVAFRCSLILPATTVDQPMKLAASWKATAPFGAEVWTLTFCVILAGAVAQFAIGPMIGSAVGWALAAAWQWLSLMVGASLLTTLYGVIIEERPLD